MPPAVRVTVDADSRILLPGEILQAMGIGPGSELLLTVEGDALLLRTREAAWQRLREVFQGVSKRRGSVVDELIAERREEARRDS